MTAKAEGRGQRSEVSDQRSEGRIVLDEQTIAAEGAAIMRSLVEGGSRLAGLIVALRVAGTPVAQSLERKLRPINSRLAFLQYDMPAEFWQAYRREYLADASHRDAATEEPADEQQLHDLQHGAPEGAPVDRTRQAVRAEEMGFVAYGRKDRP